MWFNLCTSLFADPANRIDDEKSLQDLLDFVTFKLNKRYLERMHRMGQRVPNVYAGHLRYIPEEPGVEDWCDIGRVLQRGGGDCEDLAAYHAAWLRFYAEDRNAQPVLTSQEQHCPTGTRPPCRQYHVLVRRGNGQLEDPSARLGMHSALRGYGPAPIPSYRHPAGGIY